MTLYLKYRPQTFDELDLESVRVKLGSIVVADSVPHAFLFAGPKGTGKTSAARILAKYLNCESPKNGEPCNKCSHCRAITHGQSMDVIELDAASNRGIDDIRLLREQVILAPSSAKKKVYILDEAHMLTTEAANAFLKTLEEPPSHVTFILATTDPQKLPPTILSRLTIVNFYKATETEISRQLKRVAKGEKLSLDVKSTNLIASASDGSFRDALKILEDLLLTGKKITPELVTSQLSQIPSVSSSNFITLLSQKNAEAALLEVSKLTSFNASIKSFTDALIQCLRISLLAKEGIGGTEKNIESFSKRQTIRLINDLIKARSKLSQSPIESLPLELVTIKWCGLPDKSSKKKALITPQKVTVDNFDEASWSKIMSEVRTKNASVEAFLRAARPLECDGKHLTIGVYYRFHKERLEVGENKLTLEEAAAHVLGNHVKVSFTLAERQGSDKLPAKESLTDSSDEDIIRVAKEVFGT